jgi:nitrogen fixation protein FixH
VAGLGAIVATVVVGARVREETVVARPYEDGLRHDAERGARAALGLEVRLAPPEAGEGPIAFELIDGAGRPVDDGAVTLELSRPDTSRDMRAAAARAGGSGRWSAALAFPAAGPWDVRFDVARGGDRVRLERRVQVQAPCDLGAGPCTRPLAGGGEVTLELSPRPLAPMRELAVAASLRGVPGAEGAAVAVSFAMPGMDMGRNEARLAPAGAGRHAGRAVLVRCPSGRGDWTAEVRVERPGAPAGTARFRLAVRE